MQKIHPCLWFDTNAEEAANFYVSVFKNSKITAINYYGDNGPLPKGTVLVVYFNLNGHDFMALNGGPLYKFSPATSFVVNCGTQEEIDHYWEKLLEGGKEENCGWLQDKYGVSWQIVPSILGELMSSKDPAKAQRVINAFLKMKKFDIKTLEEA
ncbi:MAG: VOC family protein [Ignavibacteria bacterium]|nr:VOC family protein [Ignavibacteria bacterium]